MKLQAVIGSELVSLIYLKHFIRLHHLSQSTHLMSSYHRVFAFSNGFKTCPALLEIYVVQRQGISFGKVVCTLGVKHVNIVIDSIVWLLGTYVHKGCAATF